MAHTRDLPPPPRDLLRDASLFLDFDGTLVELADTPDAVSVDDALAALLADLGARLDGRVALVSGRSIAKLDDLLGDRGLHMVGSHGAETRLAGGTIERPDRPAALDDAGALFADRLGAHDGVVIETKALGVGVHYRLAPSAKQEAHALVEAFARAHQLEVQHGKMMVELRLPGHDKGSAIAALMARAPFAGHMPVFLGDDLTDEPGFAACATHGGAGILVGPARDSAAGYRLDDVAAVHAFLKAAV
ncbi:trehalose-phosphatase [Sphingomonas koreensis]|nr:trehalose-phosphatase [Sphingomonas koreensis]